SVSSVTPMPFLSPSRSRPRQWSNSREVQRILDHIKRKSSVLTTISASPLQASLLTPVFFRKSSIKRVDIRNYMRNQALQSKLLHARPLPLNRLVNSLSLKAQRKTQTSGARPYGVGLLIIGTDATGPHLWEFLPSGS